MDIVQMSVQAGVLIAAITIIRAITLYRLPKTSFLALWGLAVARLLIPFSLISKWSIYNLIDGLLEHEEASAPAGEFVIVWSDLALGLPRTAVPVEDHTIITKWREEYRLFRPLAIVRSDRVDSPASIGILRPRIIFP